MVIYIETGEYLTRYKEKEYNCEDTNHWSNWPREVLESVLGDPQDPAEHSPDQSSV